MTRRRGPRRRFGRVLIDASSLATLLPAPLAGYLVTITCAAWWSGRAGRDVTVLPTEPTSRFAILVPAHDEEELIGDTLASLRNADYPSELVRVHVIADHCTDATVTIARGAGVEVHEHVDPEPAGKGHALQWALEHLRARGDEYDVAVVLDADSVVDAHFLRVLDARVARGAEVVQAFYAVRAAGASADTTVRSAALALRHFVRPLGRTALGGSCGLFGNGMAFTPEILRDRRWTDHLTEDLEFQVELVLDGVRVEFAPDARIEAEMPATLEQGRSQNERWERGRIDLVRRYVPRLVGALRAAPRGRRWLLLDTAADLTVPPLSVLTAGAAASTLWSALTAAVAPSKATKSALAGSILTSGAVALHVVGGLRVARVPPPTGRQAVRALRLIAWKVALWVRMVVRPGDVEWTRTRRNPVE